MTPEEFSRYKKIVEVAFSLTTRLTLKMVVEFNYSYQSLSGHLIEHPLHSEFVKPSGEIISHAKYRYHLELSPKKDYKFSLYIDWDNYDDLVTLIETVVEISNPNHPSKLYKRIYANDGMLVDIKCDRTKIIPLYVNDMFGKTLSCVPIVIYDDGSSMVTEGVRFTLCDALDFDIPISRIKGFRRFLMTYNPMMHASMMSKYLPSVPLLGTNASYVKDA